VVETVTLWTGGSGLEWFDAQGDSEVAAEGSGSHEVAECLDGMAVAADEGVDVVRVEKHVKEQSTALLGLGDGNLIAMRDQRSDYEFEAFAQRQRDVHAFMVAEFRPAVQLRTPFSLA